MALGAIEVLVIDFPGNRFNGDILPELERLVETNTISIVDGLFLHKDAEGDVEFSELSEVGADESVARLASTSTARLRSSCSSTPGPSRCAMRSSVPAAAKAKILA